MEPIVILGSGLAGYSVAKELRKLDAEVPIVVLTRDDGAWYSKPMLSNAFAARKTATDLAASSAEKMSAQHGIDVRPGTEAAAIHPAAREVQTQHGRLPYCRLVLALGADPVRLHLPGGDALHCVNDLADYGRFRVALASARRVAILGAGLIGCEFANDLAASGYQVSVVDPAAWPLSRLVPSQAGHALQEALAELGVQWHLGRRAAGIEPHGKGARVCFADGAHLEADVVLSAVGLRPRVHLARAAGLATACGIVTDRWLRTSDPHIYALGDCAEVSGLVLPFVLPIMHASRALARTLAGQSTPVAYPAMPVAVKTPALPVTVAPPPPSAAGEWQIDADGRDVTALCRDADGVLVGFVLTGAAHTRKQELTKALPPLLA